MRVCSCLLIVSAVLGATFDALFKAIPQGPAAVLAVAAVLTAAAGLIGAIKTLASWPPK